MEKRIAALSTDPHTVSLTDRACSLFIDPKTGSIFVDEGDGEDRMNGAVFLPVNGPSFSVWPSTGPDHRLILDYRGIQYFIGASGDGSALRRWAESANSLLTEKGNQDGVPRHASPGPVEGSTGALEGESGMVSGPH
jgi:hypothetical protein